MQQNHPKHLVGLAAGIFLVSLPCFDGWGLFLVFLVLLVIVGWIKRQRWVQIEDTLLIFGILGSLGIGLWFLFGVESVAPVAIFLAILARYWSITLLGCLWSVIQQIVLVIAIGVQTILIAHGGIISLQDGTFGASCEPTERITIYLAQHYAGGKILEDVNAFQEPTRSPLQSGRISVRYFV